MRVTPEDSNLNTVCAAIGPTPPVALIEWLQEQHTHGEEVFTYNFPTVNKPYRSQSVRVSISLKNPDIVRVSGDNIEELQGLDVKRADFEKAIYARSAFTAIRHLSRNPDSVFQHLQINLRNEKSNPGFYEESPNLYTSPVLSCSIVRDGGVKKLRVSAISESFPLLPENGVTIPLDDAPKLLTAERTLFSTHFPKSPPGADIISRN